MRAHVGDTGGLCRSTRGGHGCGRAHGVRGPAGNEAPANLTRGIELALSKRASTSNGFSWSAVCRSLRLEQGQDSLSTVRRPRRDQAAISFTQRLGGRHAT